MRVPSGCDKANDVESVRHFLLVCSRWSAERELLMSNVFLSDLSLSMKARLGSIDANPDMWLRLVLGGPMHEMGVEYTEAIAVLLDVGSRYIGYRCGSRTPGGAGPHYAALGHWSPRQELVPAAGGSGWL